MTDAPTIPEGFTAHDGGPCPVHPDTVVEVILGIGREYQSASAEYFFWLECGRYSVIAYKVITPYVEPTDEAGQANPYPFINAIMKQSPNGEVVKVQYHPNGDWSVFDRIKAVIAPMPRPSLLQRIFGRV